MTQDEILEMARKAGFVVTHIGDPIGTNYTMIENFANLVAAHEREECAKILDEEALDAYTFDDSLARATEGYAELIRERGEG